MNWAAVIEEAIKLLRKWSGIIAAYFAGLAAGEEKAEDAADKADDAARKDQDEKDAEFHRRIRDDERRERLRDRLEKPSAD